MICRRKFRQDSDDCRTTKSKSAIGNLMCCEQRCMSIQERDSWLTPVKITKLKGFIQARKLIIFLISFLM